LVSLRIEEGNISALYRDATKRIEESEISEKSWRDSRKSVWPVMPEIKVQQAVAINGRTSSEDCPKQEVGRRDDANESRRSLHHRHESTVIIAKCLDMIRLPVIRMRKRRKGLYILIYSL
ncbi:hypothetical protein COOONC_11777, partial [Cooperia oncophora]